MSFRMEGIVFKKGFKKYILDNESIPTIKHEKGSVFNREPILQVLDFNASNDIIISKIKAFGISSQGCHTEIEGKRILIFSANEIKNKTLLSWFDKNSIGEILLDIDKSLYIKTREGIIKLNRFKWDN